MRGRLGLLVVVVIVGAGGAAPAWAQPGSLSRITGPSPFAAGCNGTAQTGTLFRNAEVEPWVSSNPADAAQPDRGLAAGSLVQRRRAGSADRCLVRSRRVVAATDSAAVLALRGRQSPPTAATTSARRTRG